MGENELDQLLKRDPDSIRGRILLHPDGIAFQVDSYSPETRLVLVRSLLTGNPQVFDLSKSAGYDSLLLHNLVPREEEARVRKEAYIKGENLGFSPLSLPPSFSKPYPCRESYGERVRAALLAPKRREY